MNSELKPCPFCERWDWGEASAFVEPDKSAHIYLASGSFRFPMDEQFKYCRVCGRTNPNRRAGEKEAGHG